MPFGKDLRNTEYSDLKKLEEFIGCNLEKVAFIHSSIPNLNIDCCNINNTNIYKGEFKICYPPSTNEPNYKKYPKEYDFDYDEVSANNINIHNSHLKKVYL